MCDMINLIKKENSRASKKNMFEERKIITNGLSSENLGSFTDSKNPFNMVPKQQVSTEK